MSLFYECLSAFCVGGALCVIAQLLIDLTRLTPARILVGFVVAGVALGALGLYEPLYRFAGCGVSVPLLGFGGVLARGVREAIHAHGALGILSGGLSAAAASTTAAMVLGLLCALIFKSRPKRA